MGIERLPIEKCLQLGGGGAFFVDMFFVGKSFQGLMDTGAACSITSRMTLPVSVKIRNVPAVHVKMGDGTVVTVNEEVDIGVGVGTQIKSHKCFVLSTDAFHTVVGTDFSFRITSASTWGYKSPTIGFGKHHLEE